MEIEVKVKLENPEELREKLQKIEFVKKVFEKNYVLDNGCLLKSDRLLRIREVDSKVFLTYKGERLKHCLKMREEIEVEVENKDNMIEIFKNLGFEISYYYEKEREIYRYKNSRIMIDKLPELGYYLEVEGEEIFEVLKILGIGKEKVLTKTYLEIAEEIGKNSLCF